MTILKYKDYQGSVTFSEGNLIVQVLHIDDLIMTEFQDSLKADEVFKELVDDYVETCKSIGRQPCKPFKGTFNIRVSPVLHRQAAMAASAENMTLNAWVSKAIETAVDHDTNQNKLAAELILSRRTFEQNISMRNLYDALGRTEAELFEYSSSSYDVAQVQKLRQDILIPERRREPNEYEGH